MSSGTYAPSPERKLARHAGRGCLRGLALQALATVVVGPAMVAILVVTLLLAQDRRFGPFVAFGAAMVLAGSLFGALIAVLFTWNQRRLRSLDPSFSDLGDVRGKMFLQNGRLWRGEVGGRRLDAYLFRGPHLELYVSGSLRTRLGASRPGRLSRMAGRALGREPIAELDPSFDVFAPDPDWARAVFSDPGVRSALPRLLADDRTLRVLTVLPDAVMLRVAHARIPDLVPQIGTIVADLTTLAAVGEAVPPAELLVSSPLEVSNRVARGKLAGRIMCVMFLIFGVFSAVTTGIVMLAAFLGG